MLFKLLPKETEKSLKSSSATDSDLVSPQLQIHGTLPLSAWPMEVCLVTNSKRSEIMTSYFGDRALVNCKCLE
jgi:hypothetical protein